MADDVDNNPGAPEFDDYGLRPNYTGTGYADINGSSSTGSDVLEFTFTAVPGDYQLTFRLANGTAPGP